MLVDRDSRSRRVGRKLRRDVLHRTEEAAAAEPKVDGYRGDGKHDARDQGDCARYEDVERDPGKRARHHAVDDGDDARDAEERSPRGRGQPHVGETALHVVVSSKDEVTSIVTRKLEVVVTDAIDGQSVDGVLDPGLKHAYESHGSQEDERGKD